MSYLNLETYRKAGVAVATQVWFAAAGGTLCVHSLADAGKVKRIRSRAQVRIAPCDIRGKLKGEWVGASARIVHGEEAALGHRLLDQKYGWMKRFGALLNCCSSGIGSRWPVRMLRPDSEPRLRDDYRCS